MSTKSSLESVEMNARRVIERTASIFGLSESCQKAMTWTTKGHYLKAALTNPEISGCAPRMPTGHSLEIQTDQLKVTDVCMYPHHCLRPMCKCD